jgi:hypothetical protein
VNALSLAVEDALLLGEKRGGLGEGGSGEGGVLWRGGLGWGMHRYGNGWF